jgi:acyl carrier protein
MSDSAQVMVRFALAAHLERDPRSFDDDDELGVDLGLDRLDLAMLALRCERTVGGEFPFALLDEVETVGELIVLVGSWLESTVRDTALDVLGDGDRPTLPMSMPPMM